MLWIEPKDLKSALAAVKPAVHKSSNLPLSGVRIYTEGGSAYMVATDMTNSVRRRLRAKVQGDIDVLLGHADLEKVANLNLKRGEIELQPNDDGALAACDTRDIALKTRGARDDWPNVSFERTNVHLEAEGPALAKAINRAALWASKDDTRPHLTGVLVDTTEDTPLLVSTDSYRLGIEPVPVLESVKRDTPMNIPRSGLLIAAKLMAKAGHAYLFEGTTTVGRKTANGKGERSVPLHAVIEIDPGHEDETIIASRTIEGRFPSWRQLLPDSWEYDVCLPTGEFLEACNAAKAIATRNAPMRVSVNGFVDVAVTAYDDQPALKERIAGAVAKGPSGDTPHGRAETLKNSSGYGVLEIGLNPDFAYDAAKAAGECSTMTMRLISPLRPALFEAGGLKVLLMPIRLNV